MLSREWKRTTDAKRLLSHENLVTAMLSWRGFRLGKRYREWREFKTKPQAINILDQEGIEHHDVRLP